MRGLRRLRNLWRGDALAREFDDEIAFHFEQRIAANVARGLPRAQAEREAHLHFGSVTLAREGMREARVAAWVPAFARDVRVALRALRFILNRVRLHLPSSLRHGLANLYRPGNQSAAVLASLYPASTILLAAVALSEWPTKRQALGMATAVVAVVLIAM